MLNRLDDFRLEMNLSETGNPKDDAADLEFPPAQKKIHWAGLVQQGFRIKHRIERTSISQAAAFRYRTMQCFRILVSRSHCSPA
jgi:hypothetical protein